MRAEAASMNGNLRDLFTQRVTEFFQRAEDFMRGEETSIESNFRELLEMNYELRPLYTPPPSSPSFFSNSTINYNDYYYNMYEHHQHEDYQQPNEPILLELQPVAQQQPTPNELISPELNPLSQEAQQQQNVCTICFDRVTEIYPVEIRCGHIYHYGCLQEWLEYNPHCPNCRYYSTIDDCSIILY